VRALIEEPGIVPAVRVGVAAFRSIAELRASLADRLVAAATLPGDSRK